MNEQAFESADGGAIISVDAYYMRVMSPEYLDA
jgi:hypothetical protein